MMTPAAYPQSLLVRMPNWIGDCVMALPALNYLKSSGFALTLVGKSWLADLFGDTWPIISSDKKVCKQVLRQHSTRNYLLLTNSFSSAWLGRCAYKKCYGYKTDGRGWLLTKKFTKPQNKHEATLFLNLAQQVASTLNPALTTPIVDTPLACVLDTSAIKTIKKDATQLKKKYPLLAKPFLLICPFAAGLNKQKQSKIWPHWLELVKHLKINSEIPIVCCPGPTETTQAGVFSELDITIISDVSIRDYLAVMLLATSIVGNDTGPMHLASMVNTHCLTLFGATDPKRTRPIGQSYFGDLGHWPSCESVLNQLLATS